MSAARATLELLMDGNRRFVRGEGRPDQRRVERIADFVEGQNPFAAVLGCSDSRVPVEVVFDAGFGDLFPVRIAGSVATTEAVASLEYAVSVLDVDVVLVLGHSNCGAVGAALGGGTPPGSVAALLEQVHTGAPGASISEAVEANVRRQVEKLRRVSGLIAEAEAAGSVVVAGGVYDLATGVVSLLD